MAIRWRFFDGASIYTLEINPNAGGSPKLDKRMHRDVPTNPAPGFTIRQEGRPQVPTGQFGGSIRSLFQYELFLDWWMHKPNIFIIDDLGRAFTIVPTGLTLTPNFTPRTPWRTTYLFSYALVDPAVI